MPRPGKRNRLLPARENRNRKNLCGYRDSKGRVPPGAITGGAAARYRHQRDPDRGINLADLPRAAIPHPFLVPESGRGNGIGNYRAIRPMRGAVAGRCRGGKTDGLFGGDPVRDNFRAAELATVHDHHHESKSGGDQRMGAKACKSPCGDGGNQFAGY